MKLEAPEHRGIVAGRRPLQLDQPAPRRLHARKRSPSRLPRHPVELQRRILGKRFLVEVPDLSEPLHLATVETRDEEVGRQLRGQAVGQRGRHLEQHFLDLVLPQKVRHEGEVGEIRLRELQ